MNRKGLSLLEILVASLILTLVLAGLLNTFLAGRRWVLHNRLRMTGGELGKYFLDPLQMHVTQGERSVGAQNGWGQPFNCLTNPAACDTTAWTDPSGIQYTPQYEISGLLIDGHNPLGRLRKVKLTLNWNEPQP